MINLNRTQFCLIAVIGCVSSSGAQTIPSYRITRIGDPKQGQYEVHALNNRGDVAGCLVRPKAKPFMTAFVWREGVLTELTTEPAGRNSIALGINEQGQVVGGVSSEGGNKQAVLWEQGKMRPLPAADEPASAQAYRHVYGINNHGQAVGSSLNTSSSGSFLPVLYESGKMVFLKRPRPSLSGGARHLNDKGQIVGSLSPSFEGDDQRAYLWEDEQVYELETPEGYDSCPNAINEAGQVVGWIRDRTRHKQAVLWENKRLTYLSTAKGLASEARAINRQGQVVGRLGDHAFLYDRGQMIDLNRCLPRNSGWHLTGATAINDRGHIVANGNKGVCLLTLTR